MPLNIGKPQNKKLREQARDEVNAVMLLARECLQDDKFKRYKDIALRHQEKLIAALVDYTNPDPIQYAFEVREMLCILGYSKLLLKDIEKEAKMEVSNYG